MRTTRIIAIAILFVGVGCAMAAERAQQSDVERINLQRHDLSFAGREVVQSLVTLAPGAEFGRHRHAGEEAIYVLEGTFEYQLEGRAPVTLRAGGVLFIPAGVVHAAKNVGDGNAVELATHIVERGKPLVEMVK